MSVKLATIYYLSTDTLQAMAERLNTAAKAAGAEVRLRHVDGAGNPPVPGGLEPVGLPVERRAIQN